MKNVLGFIVGVVSLLLLGILFYTTMVGIGAVAVYVLTTAPWWTNVIGITLGCICSGVHMSNSYAHRSRHKQINEVLQLDDD